MTIDSIKPLSVLLLCLATVPVFLYVTSHRPSTFYEAPLNPWDYAPFSGFSCGHGSPSFDKFCPLSEVIRNEILRRQAYGNGNCDSEATQKRHLIACSRVNKLAGYDEAVIQRYTPILEAMQRDQGIELPELSEDDYRACELDKYKQRVKNEPPIVFEMIYRKCAKGIM